MEPLFSRRSLLAAGALGSAAYFVGAVDLPPTPYVATAPEWGLRPGSDEDQSEKLQRLIDAVAFRGGGSIVLPNEMEGRSGSYLVQGIRPRNGAALQGLHGASLQLPPQATANLIDHPGTEPLKRFVLRNLVLDGGGQDLTLVRVKRLGSSGYAWDLGGMYDVELRDAGVGAEVDWSGQVYFRGGRIENCGQGLRLAREHLYLQDITIWNCRVGVFAEQLLHTHWDQLVSRPPALQRGTDRLRKEGGDGCLGSALRGTGKNSSRCTNA